MTQQENSIEPVSLTTRKQTDSSCISHFLSMFRTSPCFVPRYVTWRENVRCSWNLFAFSLSGIRALSKNSLPIRHKPQLINVCIIIMIIIIIITEQVYRIPTWKPTNSCYVIQLFVSEQLRVFDVVRDLPVLSRHWSITGLYTSKASLTARRKLSRAYGLVRSI